AQAVRAAMSDFEEKLAAQMQAAQDAFARQQQVIDQLTGQIQAVRAQAGPPVATLLARSLATRVQNIAAANPELGTQHFTGVLSQAQTLADEVAAVAD